MRFWTVSPRQCLVSAVPSRSSTPSSHHRRILNTMRKGNFEDALLRLESAEDFTTGATA